MKLLSSRSHDAKYRTKFIGNIPFESNKSVKETKSLNRHIFNLRYLLRTEMLILEINQSVIWPPGGHPEHQVENRSKLDNRWRRHSTRHWGSAKRIFDFVFSNLWNYCLIKCYHFIFTVSEYINLNSNRRCIKSLN